MNRKFAPDLNIVGKNSLRTNANIVKGKVQPLPEINSNFQNPNSKKVPITESPNSKLRGPTVSDFGSLDIGHSDINCLPDYVSPWLARQGRQAGNLVFGSWNFNCLYDYVSQAGLLEFEVWNL